jgi:hypothetical protein
VSAWAVGKHFVEVMDFEDADLGWAAGHEIGLVHEFDPGFQLSCRYLASTFVNLVNSWKS